jgi:hypothetical protein
MPRPLFDVEQYELRGIEPEVFTEDQRISMRKALARTHGQIDWSAQMLGFNGPNYWGKANPKSDHTYNWVGLPETMNEKRQMQTGTFGVYNKDLEYDQWPSPFNRVEVKASADQKFHVFEANGATVISPLGVDEDFTYLDDPTVVVGGSYIFDCEIEYEILYGGDQFDAEPSVSVQTEYGEEVWTRVRILRAVNGSITIKRKGSTARPLALQVDNWYDISDWTPEQVYKQYIGVWGNKGNQFSTDFLFDSLDLHASEEHYSLKQTPEIITYKVEDLMELVGLKPTGWTGLYPEKWTFRVEGCEDPVIPEFPVLGNGVGNPWFHDKYWPPTYLPDRSEMGECQPDCNTWVKSWQTLEDELYDNGEFPAFCPPGDTMYTDYDNDIFATNPQAETLLDDYEYNEVVAKRLEAEGYYNREPHPAYPTDCDEEWEFKQEPPNLDNGTFEDLAQAFLFNNEYNLVDEGIYDRLPFSGINGFEFTWEALNTGGILEPPCVTWQFDAHLDDGTLEEGFHNVFPSPPDPNEDEWLWTVGAWAIADDGVYDTVRAEATVLVSEEERTICYPDTWWSGWDDGEYDDNWRNVCDCEELPPDPNDTALCRNEGCAEPLAETCTADGDLYTFLGPPNYEEDCECAVECCLIDNEYIPPPPPYTGPIIVDGSTYTALCLPADPPPNITFCDLTDYRWIKLDAVSEVRLDFLPSVHNSFFPLRMWKNHTSMQTDEVPAERGHKEYRNFLVADDNRGTEPEDSYRHHARLPVEYPRNGKEWNRVDQVCNNQFYFSKPPKLNELDLLSEDPLPRNYYDLVNEEVDKSKKVVYHEDYANSSALDDFSEANQGGFKGAEITHEDPRPIVYFYGEVSDYDDLAERKTDKQGEWYGAYYTLGNYPETTGHLYSDIENQFLIPIPVEDYPTYDESHLKRPNITFPEENPLVMEKNYLVSYAYFTADLSASEEAVFEPQMAHCWRNPLIDSEVEVGDECVYSPLESNTAYLLHPTELDYGKRTRPTREPGEVSKAQGTYA